MDRRNNFICVFMSVLACFSVVVCVLLSCTKEDAAAPAEWDAFDFKVSESRRAGTNEFSVDVTLVKGERDAWYSLNMMIDGDYSEEVMPEGRLFVNSEHLSVPCGKLVNGQHIIDLYIRDKLDSVVVHRVSFNVLGNTH